MNRTEASFFYTSKHESARSWYTRFAYTSIIRAIDKSPTMGEVLDRVKILSEEDVDPRLRMIYRKALRELRI